MTWFVKYGSVRGAAGNSRPYRDALCEQFPLGIQHFAGAVKKFRRASLCAG